MDDLQLSETLQRYFVDLFICCCDEDKSDKVPLGKLLALIRSAGSVPEEVISQLSELCWTPNTTLINRRQFCTALKLVAAYQANIPLRNEVIGTKLELAMPRFAWPQSDLIELADGGASTDENSEATLDDCSPSASSTASNSPTPTNSVQDRNWGAAWQGLVSEEQRQLLGTEEESSDKHSSEDDDTEVLLNEVWTITPAQKEYYTAQFRFLQPDANALLAGSVARMFFEKSRLPVQELRKIWQLADVTKDGALSLEEFNIAMHLVVLRRHNIELPDALPSALATSTTASTAASVTANTTTSSSRSTTPDTLPTAKEHAKEWTKFVDSPTNNSATASIASPVKFGTRKDDVDKDPLILHPVALRVTPEAPPPTTTSNNEDDVDGGGSSPKKFVENNINSAIQRPQPKKFNLPGPGAIPPPPSNSIDDGGPVSLPAFPPPKKEKPPPPPPRPFKTHGRSSSLDLNRLNKTLQPPSVPPRVSPNVPHSTTSKKLINQRSEGCENDEFANFDHFEQYENVTNEIFPGDQYEAERKKLFAQFASPNAETAPQPQPPPLPPHDVVAPPSDSSIVPPRKHGAFEIYRKPRSRDSPTNNNNTSASSSSEDRAKFELFVRLQEQNTVLLRICQELSQELADVREEKVALKVRLEKQLNGG